MQGIRLLKNSVKDYTWGSSSFIQELMGDRVSFRGPAAELWLGTHPMGPSKIVSEDNEESLEEVINRNPVEFLGKDAARRFPSGLPFLFKVIAAAKPLSIQVHPDRLRAREGFHRENAAGIPLGSPLRSYRDESHKPELLCALSEFHALKGFRPAGEAWALLRDLDVELGEVESFSTAKFFRNLLSMDQGAVSALLHRVSGAAKERAGTDAAIGWVFKLGLQYPDDPGCLAPVLLNLISLRPQEALYVSPGEIHAYLEGAAVEVMANSDNVIRGGLTAKRIDRTELMEALNVEEKPCSVMVPVAVGSCEMQYRAQAEEFMLSIIEVDGAHAYRSAEKRNIEVYLCTCGSGKITEAQQGCSLPFERGDSFVVPAFIASYSLTGTGKLFKVTIPSIQP
ncbi:MAG: mannose-6-phosphate isomerase, class I [Deltaproteobacteria bacterium CG_4_8_14_3_um_filter_51_11]|nr:MAG: mannose-6-phosphate isomerase, class I [Deltaproteobacteria bacterium CG_4_8_14_3_um_filter_51_11]